MSDGPQEYEVESVTRARVHDKKGKKITWRYYVKWKGYDWNESTWEPRDSFEGSEHILEAFWERMDTGGRDISDATAFKRGEELLISGPPGRKGLKRKASSVKTLVSPPEDVSSSNGVSISAPPLSMRKRRRVEVTMGDEWGYSKPRRRVSTAELKNGGTSARSPRRRRASSPGLKKSAPKRLPSVGDSQLDADGETDPDVVEVEDELMQVSAEDAEDDNTRTRDPATASGSTDVSKKITFDDLEHFYNGNQIDIDQNADEQVPVQKPETRSRLHSPPATVLHSDDAAQTPASPPLSPSDPLFGSPSHLSDEASEGRSEPILPAHRARAANPLVKLLDATTQETTSKQSRITAKARLMSIHTTGAPSTSGSRGVAKRGGKPGPGRSSSGLISKNRSSLLTSTKGSLKSVMGNFTGTTVERDQPDEIEEAPGKAEGDKLLVTSWSDEDVAAGEDHQAMSNPQLGPPPSGDELLKLAGINADTEALPDYEDDAATQPQAVETQGSGTTSAPAEAVLPNQPLIEVTVESKTSDHVADPSPSLSKAEHDAPAPVTGDPSVSPAVTPLVDEAVKANIELAKEHLFPSTQTSLDSFNIPHASFRSTIFGPLPSTTFKVILGDGVELPLVLKDSSEIKARISDILIGKSCGSKVAVFYSAVDALAMVSTLKGDGTARVVLDPSAEMMQHECFSTFLQRFESSHTLVAPVGTEVCVLYSSENAAIAEKLGAPAHLRGLSSTLLISHASIENQLAYVAAIMKATAL
ncbi:hypothetical protein EV363DRAFT_1544509 [Boletus edulis]|nr:hypothetical protein EV363DRAFT_1544509 [Boletus edulis]